MRQFLLLFAIAPFALNTYAAGPLILGARGGVPVTSNDFVASTLGLADQRFAIGPTVGVRLPMGFSVEGDALYNRETVGLPVFSGITGIGTHADGWEFPVMVKFTPSHSFVSPVLGAGVSVRHINNFGSLPTEVLNGSLNANAVGFVAGAGLRLKAGPVNITPEIRYTRWNSGNLAQSLISSVTSDRNEAQVLIGLTF